MKVSVTKRFNFEAAHFLPNYKGSCHKVHGHSYKLEITVTGRVENDVEQPDYGMIIDFKKLKALVNDCVVDKVDHSLLNEVFDYPTAERMVQTIFNNLRIRLELIGLELERVRLWETEDSYAECVK